MHETHREVCFPHFARQPLDFGALVAENDALGHGQCVVKVAQCLKLVFVAFNRHKELADAFKGQLVSLHQYLDRILHEFVGHLQDLLRKRGGNHRALEARRQVTIDLVDSVLESLAQHFVGLIENKHLDRVRLESATAYHLENATWGTRNNMRSMLQVENVFVDVSTANAAMDFHLHEVTKGETDTLCLLSQFTSWGQNEHLWLSEGKVNSLQ